MMVTGFERNSQVTPAPGEQILGLSLLLSGKLPKFATFSRGQFMKCAACRTQIQPSPEHMWSLFLRHVWGVG